MNKKILIPLRSGFIIFLALLSEELIRSHNWQVCFDSFPYMIGIALTFVAIEYARIYKVQLPTTKKTNGFMPLVWV